MDNMSGYVNLLNSQTPINLDSPEPIWVDSQVADESGVKERRKWTPKEDKILIGVWFNTSKDPIVSNEHKIGAFWRRIVDYYNTSPLLIGTVLRELGQCKQRWPRINEQVCKFVGCYTTALREQRSGQNDDDVIVAALEIFHNTYDSKFSLDHAWRELRHDQKRSSAYVAKESGRDKRKPCEELHKEEAVGEEEDRPIWVKVAKARGKKKKTSGRGEELTKLQGVLEMKEKITRNKLLDRLLAKTEPLTEMETSVKLKLMSEFL